MSRVLVTGDAGFIGFHTAKRLLSKGHTILGIDALTDYYDPALKRDRLAQLQDNPSFEHQTIRLEDFESLNEAVTTFRPEIVIHLAAQAGVRYSLEAPRAYIDSNVVGTFNLLEIARELSLTHFMLASSSSVYGGNQSMPFREIDRADSPVSLYAASKKATEEIAHSYSHLWKIPTTAFRFFTVYGPWGRPDMALFKFVKAIENDEPIDVYGQGNMRRDFTYIDDLVDAIARLAFVPPQLGEAVHELDSLSPVAPFRAVNLGGGKPIGLMPFIQAVESALGISAQKNMLDMQQGDVVETFADPSLLRALIGDVPDTDIDAGVRSFVDWYRGYYSNPANG